jgi:hypothetical protein
MHEYVGVHGMGLFEIVRPVVVVINLQLVRISHLGLQDSVYVYELVFCIHRLNN